MLDCKPYKEYRYFKQVHVGLVILAVKCMAHKNSHWICKALYNERVPRLRIAVQSMVNDKQYADGVQETRQFCVYRRSLCVKLVFIKNCQQCTRWCLSWHAHCILSSSTNNAQSHWPSQVIFLCIISKNLLYISGMWLPWCWIDGYPTS